MNKKCPTCGGTGKIKVEKKKVDNAPKWRLFEKKFFVKNRSGKEILFQIEYAIFSPENICTRYFIDAPLGHLLTKMIYEGVSADGGEFWFWDFTGQKLELLLDYEGWHKSKKKVDESNLAKGYIP